MSAVQKLEVLKDVYEEEPALDRVLAKLLEVVLNEYRLRLQRYDQTLEEFESRYEMDSETFYEHFETGELGDAMDFFEWAGLYELRQDLLEKIQRLEQVV